VPTLFEEFLIGMNELESDKLETAFLKPGDDLANESALDTIGLG
jgi:hypothetical protein